MRHFLPRVRIAKSDHADLVRLTQACLEGCRTIASDGTVIFCPDGQGHYPAMWTRDLCYMVEGAGNLFDPAEALGAIDYLLAGQREDGVIPDHRQADGYSAYKAGPPGKPLGYGPPADNGPFMAKLICAYARVTNDYSALERRVPAIAAALDAVPLGSEGLVHIDPNRPVPGYGFTDSIGKTGKDFFASLLYWEACQNLARTCVDFEYHEEAREWYERCEKMYDHLNELWDAQYGMFRSASHDCRQLDIWGSAYAAVVRAASKSQAQRIAEALATNFDDFSLSGHVRHLPVGEYWKRTLADVPRDTYQNGGYWTIPTAWVAQTITLVDEELGRSLVLDALNEFREFGVHEWITPYERHVPGYVASAACLLAGTMPTKVL